MKIKPLIQSLIACGFLSTAFVVNADITLTDKNGGETLFSEQFISYPINEDNMDLVIMKIASNISTTTINNSKKQYYKTTLGQICEDTSAISAQLDNTAEKINKAIMSDEMRAKLKAKYPEIVTIKTHKKNVNVAGYLTTEYHIYEDDDLMEVLWLSEDKKLVNAFSQAHAALGKVDCYNVRSNYSDDYAYKALIKKGVVLQSYSNGGSYIKEHKVEEYFTHNDIDYDDFNDINIVEIINIDFSDISPEKFSVPKGYKEVTVMEFFKTDDNLTENNIFNENTHEYQATSSTEETVINEPAAEELSNKQKAIDKIKKLAEKEGGAVGKLLGKLF